MGIVDIMDNTLNVNKKSETEFKYQQVLERKTSSSRVVTNLHASLPLPLQLALAVPGSPEYIDLTEKMAVFIEIESMKKISKHMDKKDFN